MDAHPSTTETAGPRGRALWPRTQARTLAEQQLDGLVSLRLRRCRILNRFLAACVLSAIAWRWTLGEQLLSVAPWTSLSLVLSLFFALVAGTVIGLLRMRAFGFYCAYLLVPVSTLLLGVPLLPFTSLLPTLDLRIAAVALVNVLFLVATAASHRTWNRVLGAGTRRL